MLLLLDQRNSAICWLWKQYRVTVTKVTLKVPIVLIVLNVLIVLIVRNVLINLLLRLSKISTFSTAQYIQNKAKEREKRVSVSVSVYLRTCQNMTVSKRMNSLFNRTFPVSIYVSITQQKNKNSISNIEFEEGHFVLLKYVSLLLLLYFDITYLRSLS